MKLENAEIYIEGGYEDLENIVECLGMIYGTVRGTFPMNRDFGIDGEILDYPLSTAKKMLEIDIRKQTELYEKRVDVQEVTFTYDQEKDAIKPFITVSINEEYMDEMDTEVEVNELEDELSEINEYEREEDDGEWI